MLRRNIGRSFPELRFWCLCYRYYFSTALLDGQHRFDISTYHVCARRRFSRIAPVQTSTALIFIQVCLVETWQMRSDVWLRHLDRRAADTTQTLSADDASA